MCQHIHTHSSPLAPLILYYVHGHTNLPWCFLTPQVFLTGKMSKISKKFKPSMQYVFFNVSWQAFEYLITLKAWNYLATQDRCYELNSGLYHNHGFMVIDSEVA